MVREMVMARETIRQFAAVMVEAVAMAGETEAATVVAMAEAKAAAGWLSGGEGCSGEGVAAMVVLATAPAVTVAAGAA